MTTDTLRALVLPLLTLASIATIAKAQDLALGGAETHQVEAPAVVGGGGVAASASFTLEVAIEPPSSVVGEAASESYRALGGATLFGAAPTTGPVAFGVREGTGTKDGGQTVTVFGRGLAGGGTPTVALGGVPLTGVQVASGAELSGVTGLAVNGFGNPIGGADLTVATGLGSAARPGAYVYTPAIVLDSLPVVDAAYGISIHADAGDVLSMSWGLTIPGVALPLFNLDGAIEILTNITPVIPFTPAPAGGHFQLTAAIPDAPSLAGIQVPLQALAFDDLATLSGSFTNLFLLPIQ